MALQYFGKRAFSSARSLMAHANLTQELVREIDATVNGRISTNSEVLLQHGTDESYHTPAAPDLVAYPESAAEVSRLLSLASAARVPVVPFGAGTSLEGHVAALRGGISLDTSRMARILAVDPENAVARVEPGVTRGALNAALRHEGLMFSVDPGADASIGGMAATRASGTTTVRCGTMRENVLAAEVALADGRIMQLGRPVPKSSTGYDLLHLFIGSEGTLGVFTELTVRLWPQPEAVAAAVCTFDDMEGLVGCATAAMQTAAPVARMEMMDEVTVRAVNQRSGTAFAEAPTLLFEFVGTQAGVDEASAAAQQLASDFRGSDFRWSATPEGRAELWGARHEAYWASHALRPGARGYPTDVCVPISALAASVMHAKAAVAARGLLAPMVGHVGDGNYHMMLLVDPADSDEVAAAKQVVEDIVEKALELGGSCSGEHGIGHGKLKYLVRQHGEAAVQTMAAIKRALDPHDILNPGKLGSASMFGEGEGDLGAQKRTVAGS